MEMQTDKPILISIAQAVDVFKSNLDDFYEGEESHYLNFDNRFVAVDDLYDAIYAAVDFLYDHAK